ncbi:MAG: RHS repeat-associated core domain-containing protein [Lachnospiraceae bacterium]|nr:RHS repeat-associated core domain-containing protein [Lachnospiraceae bacterium]
MRKRTTTLLKRAINLFVIVCIIVSTFANYMIVSSATSYDSENIVIQTKKITDEGVCVYNGQVNIEEQLMDLHSGIIRLLGNHADVYEKYEYGNNIYDNDNSIFSQSYIKINVNKMLPSKIIVAENDIIINASEILSNEKTIIYSKSGNISINAGSVDFNGIIYAPNGKVSVSSSNVLIDGVIIAEETKLSVGVLQINGVDEISVMTQNIRYLSNDITFEISCYYDKDNNKYDIILDDQEIYENYFDKMEVYVRRDTSNSFELLNNLKDFKNAGELDFDEKIDVVVKGTTRYNEIKYSDIESFILEDNVVKYANIDVDEDGISDGEEILFTKTDPNNKDTDGDGFADNIECIYLLTNPCEYTENNDVDEDGLNYVEEISNGTHPYLNDSDLDGLLDGDDNVRIYTGYEDNNSEAIIPQLYNVGRYDVVINGFGEDGKVYQYVYNYLTGDVKEKTVGDLQTIYYYDAYGKVILKLEIYGEESKISTYEYDSDGNMLYFSNDGDIYSFIYNNGMVSEVYLNDNLIVSKNEGTINYGNGDVISISKNAMGETVYSINDRIVNQWGASDKNFIDMQTGIEYIYNYNDEGLDNIVSSLGYNIAYYEDESIYNVIYQYSDTVKEQTIYKPDFSKVCLVSGDEYTEENYGYKISNSNGVLYSIDCNYSEDGIRSLSYNTGEIVDYVYDNNKILAIKDSDGLKKEYEYNSEGKLIKYTDYADGIMELYKYDIHGNISCVKKENILTGNIICENIYEYKSSINSDVLTSYNGNTIVYDQIGNPLTYYDGTNIYWEGRELKGISNDDNEVEYTYDYYGRRTTKTVNDVTTFCYYDGQDIILEVIGDEMLWYIYDERDTLIGFNYRDCNYYYKKNMMGDVIGIINDLGEFVCGYTYDPWGAIVNVYGNEDIANINPIRYKSYYYDQETGFYYLKSRYYDPNMRRFLNMDDVSLLPDKIIDDNLYSYCSGDPVNNYDPTGNATISVVLYTIDREDFKSASHAIKNEVLAKSNTVFSETVSNDTKVFIDWWRNLPETDIVIICAHGAPDGIGTAPKEKSATLVSKYHSFGQKPKPIKLLVLLSCYCGHLANSNDNFALTLSRSISGRVIASDGAVEPLMTSNNKIYFKSFYDKDNPNIGYYDNKGWVQYYSYKKNDTVSDAGIYNLTVDHIFFRYNVLYK